MNGPVPNTLPKKERLCGKTGIGKLLAEGRHGNVTGLRCVYLNENGCDYNRIMVSVPKKMFKRAVKRNLLKRRIRESWRKQKASLNSSSTDILFIYPTKEILSYEQIYTAVGQIIEKINKAAENGKQE
ncbi:MAG: ribonuclease P protein component [Bacteroidales bacterium]|nr:ribonuclease P protein component [Bacteroidales bacterium]